MWHNRRAIRWQEGFGAERNIAAKFPLSDVALKHLPSDAHTGAYLVCIRQQDMPIQPFKGRMP
ncbi:MAG: hypothetical protein DBY37_06965 [Desulfovibrionaceae bacterium]|nr:MAG: hypothetical protein DBY37_06965 [Desulfovibrionaceae bacterium]